MMIKSRYKIWLLFIILPGVLIAQNQTMNLQVFAGGSLPTGNFVHKIEYPTDITRKLGFDYGQDAGLASTGFTFGLEFTTPVLIDGLGWQLSMKYINNPTDKSTIESEFNMYPEVTGELVFETGNWINIPLFSGFSYGLNVYDLFNVYLHLQAGLNFTKRPSFKATLDGEVVENTEFRTMTDFGLETGISLEFRDSYVLSFRYHNLGSPRYEGNRTLSEVLFPEITRRDFDINGEARSVELILVTVGIKI